MKNFVWIALTEIRQSLLRSLALVIFTSACAIILLRSLQAEREVEHLLTPVRWNAALAILPKSANLEDIFQDIKQGKASHFLPEALFDTTLAMINGNIHLSAILARQQDGRPFIQYKGESDLGWQWVRDPKLNISVLPWHEQKDYENIDWGHKVISAMFASGGIKEMASLKDLIERKTVAQVFWIEEEYEKIKNRQQEIQSRIREMQFLFILLLAAGMALALRSMYQDLRNTLNYLFELGYSRQQRGLMLLFINVLLLLPSLVLFFIL